MSISKAGETDSVIDSCTSNSVTQREGSIHSKKIELLEDKVNSYFLH